MERPLPTPEILAQYRDGHPEVYAAMIARYKNESLLVLEEQKHRHKLDDANARNTAWGVGLAWGLMYSCVVAAIVFAFAGKPTEGLVAVIVAITALAGNLIYAKNKPPQAQAPSEEAPSDDKAPAK